MSLGKNIMERKNCWEAMMCGRQPGGGKVEELGACPAAIHCEYDGENEGTYGGRFCWAVAGTLCKGEKQGTYAKKFKSCLNCEFLKLVNEEEGREFVLTPKNPKD
jgi:hypothetical protein